MALSDIIWRKILLRLQHRLGTEWNGMVGPEADFNCEKLCLYLNLVSVTNKDRREKKTRRQQNGDSQKRRFAKRQSLSLQNQILMSVTNKSRREKKGRPNILNWGFWAPGLTQPMMAYSAATSPTEEKGPGLAQWCAPNGGSTPDEWV